jgi:predicted permease
VNSILKEEGASVSTSHGQTRLRKLMVCSQVALSLVLLIGAGLFARSLFRLMSVDSGIAADQLLAFSIDPSLHRYTPERSRRLFADLQNQLSGIPRVKSASAAFTRVMGDQSWGNYFHLEGYHPSSDAPLETGWNQVMPGFFSTLGIPLLAGREFTARDAARPPFSMGRLADVAIVNETFAKQYCGGNCIGKYLGFGRSGPTGIQIVGMVRDLKHSSLTEEPRPWTFIPALQLPVYSEMTFYLRSPRPEELQTAARKAVASLDASLPVFDMKTVRTQIDETHFTERFFAFISGAFALLAALLAAIGLYGVTAYSAARRTQEFGIRIAMGAGRSQIVWLALREAALLTGVGVVLGCAASLALGRYLESQLFQMKANDPAVFATATLAMAATALAAAFAPARRAARTDPMRALRHG